MAGKENKCEYWMCEGLPPQECALEMQARSQVDRNASRSDFKWQRHCWKDYVRVVLEMAESNNCQNLDRLRQILEEIAPDFDDAIPSELEENPVQPESHGQKY